MWVKAEGITKGRLLKSHLRYVNVSSVEIAEVILNAGYALKRTVECTITYHSNQYFPGPVLADKSAHITLIL